MKCSFLLITLCISFLLLSACGAQTPQDASTLYRGGIGTLVNQAFAPYSFENPSYWRAEEAANHITFASEASLLKNSPEKLGRGRSLPS